MKGNYRLKSLFVAYEDVSMKDIVEKILGHIILLLEGWTLLELDNKRGNKKGEVIEQSCGKITS